MPFDLKPGSLFFIAFGSAIAGLLFGSEMVRWIMAGVLTCAIVPLWVSMRRSFLAQALDDAATFLEGLRHADATSRQPDQALPQLPAQTPHDHQA